MKKRWFGLSVMIIILDLMSKSWVNQNMALGSSIPVIPGFFSITYVRNLGAAWSMLEGQRWFFIVLASVVCCVLIYYFVKEDKPWVLASLALIFAGTFGNLWDRAFFGFVRDMFAFTIFGYHFPVFNIADMSLVIGVFLIAVQLYLDERGQKNE